MQKYYTKITAGSQVKDQDKKQEIAISEERASQI
jgi:hypothetical protein